MTRKREKALWDARTIVIRKMIDLPYGDPRLFLARVVVRLNQALGPESRNADNYLALTYCELTRGFVR